MAISKAWRLGGFVAALGASGALIASATGATGAYFTDSHDGTLQAVSGHLKLNVSDTTLNFTGLMPAEDQTKEITYNTDANGNEDVWLVFPDNEAYEQFTGAKGNALWPDGGLGRYGHFAVSDSNGGLAFQSYNLQNTPTGVTGQSCTVDGNGRGGSAQQATSASDTPPYCGVPNAILLASNLVNGSSGTITVTFGLTGRQTTQNQTEFSPAAVSFQIVGTQHGVRPDAANF
ncbi:MAG TPA: hypothetical protein VN738_00700 [Acidothermaceae bacterium]|nr:hypothetical protein [Acidothermaceae bacterium]